MSTTNNQFKIVHCFKNPDYTDSKKIDWDAINDLYDKMVKSPKSMKRDRLKLPAVRTPLPDDLRGDLSSTPLQMSKSSYQKGQSLQMKIKSEIISHC